MAEGSSLAARPSPSLVSTVSDHRFPARGAEESDPAAPNALSHPRELHAPHVKGILRAAPCRTCSWEPSKHHTTEGTEGALTVRDCRSRERAFTE